MELRHLRYFAATAEELHFGRASARLGIAQPALSQQIRKLEAELGVVLLSRTRRRVALTAAGHAFLQEAHQILSRAEDAVRTARQVNAGQLGRVTIACGPVAAHVALPLILKVYHQRFPGVEVRLRESLMPEVVAKVEDGAADVGLLLAYFHSELLKRETLARLPLVAALSANHPLARNRHIALKQLAGDPFILFPHQLGSGFYECVIAVCQAAGFAPRVLDGVEHFPTLLYMIGAGYGVSLIPVLPASYRPGKSVRLIPLSDARASIEIGVVCRETLASPLVNGFLEVAREWGRKYRAG
jgi:DNA-binding transcriptional LysR family regulator